ncbi:hypothetical protein ES708_17391 [subsurface metagenome]
MEIKSTASIAEKWERVTPLRSRDYLEGIRTTRKDWAAETVAAAESYAIGVTAAIALDFSRFFDHILNVLQF